MRYSLTRLYVPFPVLFLAAVTCCGAAWAGQPSLNTTSQNRADLPASAPASPRFINLDAFRVVAANDLGMHCADVDHRVASILPPFNVVHAQVYRKAALPQKLTDSQVRVFYSAAPGSKDPVARIAPTAPVFKTNFWDINPRTGNTNAFDAYDPLYPPGILANFPMTPDVGLPVPDVFRLHLGDGQLEATRQSMPGASDPYNVNLQQAFSRFDRTLSFFSSFSFGYVQQVSDWFAADGIPISSVDDLGRANPYPLLRIQARDATGALTGLRGRVLASVDTVVPVSGEIECFICHTSSADGGNGQAACFPGVDENCPREGSPANRSGVAFAVTKSVDDTSGAPQNVKREWAADWNILRLHDAAHGTTLASETPVVCGKCHYSPALDLAHLGPRGPGDADANGKEQTIHRSLSRVIHSFHGKLDLFRAKMPAPDDPSRLDPQTGLPVITQAVRRTLNRTCYRCHPGRQTKCLRGAMFNAGLVCNDCHGSMVQVGNDFSARFPGRGFPRGADMQKRIPWASEPGCQSCHTGDALTSIAKTDPNVIAAKDGIRLLQAYRVGDLTAKPIESPGSRFAENQVHNNRVLYRMSQDSFMGQGVFCQACHGSTHAEWPVSPWEGPRIANDNQTAIELQGYPGTIMECSVCHGDAVLPSNLKGPHGMHPVAADTWIRGGHEVYLETRNILESCGTCHGAQGEGTVLSRTPIARTLQARRNVSLAKNQMVSCGLCHTNPFAGGD